MQLEQMMMRLEAQAVQTLQELPIDANIWNYRNILNIQDKAMRAVNRAYIEVNKARDELSELREGNLTKRT